MEDCKKLEDDLNKIDRFVEKLAGKPSPFDKSLNIYHGKGEDAKIKRDNLRFYLKKMRILNPSRLFLGEAPGRWGCFQTGIPFTDINTLAENNFFEKRREEKDVCSYIASFNGKKFRKESSSSTVWACLNQLSEKVLPCLSEKDLPLLWNIYPFYPWKDRKNNRTPRAEECEEGARILLKLLDCFGIKEVYPVGKKSEETLIEGLPVVIKMKKEDFVELKIKIEIEDPIVRIPYINHPSSKSCNIKNTTQTNQKSTGQKEFIKRFNDIYEIPPKTPEELDKFIERIKESKPKNKKKQGNNRKDQNLEESKE